MLELLLSVGFTPAASRPSHIICIVLWACCG